MTNGIRKQAKHGKVDKALIDGLPTMQGNGDFGWNNELLVDLRVGFLGKMRVEAVPCVYVQMSGTVRVEVD